MTLKRVLDLSASMLLLLAMSPAFLIIALLIRLDSSGPVIFRQRRVGRNGSTFVLYKFRTMQVEAPTMTTDEMKKSGLCYYTRVGTMLRRYSLDELPQLWNVVMGEMSLVGPRPSLETQEWLNLKRQSCRVDELRPGITGLAQVSGRDELSDTVKAALDADYRTRCTFVVDCRIAFQTFQAVFSGRGAN